ncbi:MAG: hypothetical protein PUE78_13770 [Clostridia bacterium]|nr:hypothetical protein [Clostridia bacterium]
MNIEEAVSIFKNISERSKKYEEMGKALHSALSPEERLQRFQERSVVTLEFYQKNQLEQKQLLSWMKGELDTSPSDEDYDVLLEYTRALYVSAYGDMFLLQELVRLLLPHYEEKKDYVHLIFLYLCLAFVNLEVSRIIHQGYGDASMDCYRKLFELAKLVDPKERHLIYRDLAVAYANVLMVETCLLTITMDEAYSYWLDAKELRNSPDFLAYMKLPESERSVAILDRFIARFETESYNIYRNNHVSATPQMVEWMEVRSEAEFKREAAKDKELLECSSDLLITHIEYLLDHNKIAPREALSTLDSYVDKRAPLLKTREDDIISFYTTYTEEILVLLPKAGLSAQEQKQILLKYTDIIESFIRKYTHDRNFAYSLNNGLWVLGFEPEFYRYIPSPEEKIERLYRFVVTRHLTTYLHSQMVAYFAETVLDRVLDRRPELFVGFHGLRNAEEVLKQKDKRVLL